MILDEIVANRKKDVEKLKEISSIESFLKIINTSHFKSYSFKNALKDKSKKINIIAEVKKASPSKGIICDKFDYISIAKSYEAGGAAAISVLTEPTYFKGSNKYLEEIKGAVNIPVLRKDFIVDPIQIYEAKAIGADAILLICAVLNDKELKNFLNLAESIGLDALVETHNEEEIKKSLDAGAQIIGINNRNLKDFKVSLEVSERLARFIPKEKIYVSESGIHTKNDVDRLIQTGANALLIGESAVKSENPEQTLKCFIE